MSGDTQVHREGFFIASTESEAALTRANCPCHTHASGFDYCCCHEKSLGEQKASYHKGQAPDGLREDLHKAVIDFHGCR